MKLLVRQAKGNRDRYTILSKKCLSMLEKYYRVFRPKDWLFTGRSPDRPIAVRTLQHALFMKKEEWILAKEQDVFPFQYFHAVFTLPDILNPIVIRNKKLLYNLLFQSVKKNLLSVSGEEKYFGAKIGFSVFFIHGDRS